MSSSPDRDDEETERPTSGRTWADLFADFFQWVGWYGSRAVIVLGTLYILNVFREWSGENFFPGLAFFGISAFASYSNFVPPYHRKFGIKVTSNEEEETQVELAAYAFPDLLTMKTPMKVPLTKGVHTVKRKPKFTKQGVTITATMHGHNVELISHVDKETNTIVGFQDRKYNEATFLQQLGMIPELTQKVARQRRTINRMGLLRDLHAAEDAGLLLTKLEAIRSGEFKLGAIIKPTTDTDSEEVPDGGGSVPD